MQTPVDFPPRVRIVHLRSTGLLRTVQAERLARASKARGPDHPAAEDDLARLPGAGPGLIWMLRRDGIGSLADLSGVEAADLRGRLGVIGQLIDLDGWIAFARRETRSET